MPIFSRLLNLKRDFLARLRNKRSHRRHRVGQAFPLQASLSLGGPAKPSPDRGGARPQGLRWSGCVGDISAQGLSILLAPAATTSRGETSIVQLAVEDREFAIPCTVAHFRVHPGHATCGLQLQFDDFQVQKSYQQLVTAVAIGAAFAATGPARREAGFLRRSWRSTGRALLTEWREPAGQTLDRFELVIGEHRLIGRKHQPGLKVHPRDSLTKRVPPAIEGEVRQLFRWLSGNLPKGVPRDLRELMSRVGRPVPPPASVAPAATPTPRAFTSTTIQAPPPGWQAPKARTAAPTG